MTDTPLLLGDRYQVGHLLGRGGMAEVHIAHDLRLGRHVAVKMLRPDLARDPAFQARFRREAQSAASLNHPAVVAVYDTGEDSVANGSVPYIVMEYVEGSTLRELLNSGRRLLPERAMEITAGVLDALDYSHRRGIVHRDIKPANVMLTRAGEVKVMDFGIARALADTSSTMTQTSAVIGTAQYLSPEQARGEQVDARSDLYSTGCLLYELLTGRPPFVGESPVAVAYQHVREEVVPPSQLDPELTPAIDAIVLKALTKNRDYRYQTAGEMRADIERALAGTPVDAPAAATTQRMAAVAAPAATVTAAPLVGHDDDPPPPPQGRRTGAYVLLVLAVLAVFALAAFAGSALFGGGAKRVQVPDVKGLPLAEATRRIEERGLRLGTQTPRADDKVPPGQVVDQSPEPNTSLSEGSAVNVVVSRAPDRTTVPTLVGLDVTQAEKAIRDNGLRLGTVQRVPGKQNANQVIKASLAPGTSVAPGTAVNLQVATGENQVPDVRGKSADEARRLLRDAGFDVREEQRDSDEAAGTVISQDPSAGTNLPVGRAVTIIVAKAKPSPSPSPSASPTATATPTATTTASPPPPEG